MNVEQLIKQSCLAALIANDIIVTESVHSSDLEAFRKTRELQKDGYNYAFDFSSKHSIVSEMYQAVLSDNYTGTPVLVKCDDEVSLWFKYKPQNSVVYADAASKTFVFNTPLDATFLRNNSSFDREVTAISVMYKRFPDYQEAVTKLLSAGFEIKNLEDLVG